MMPGGSTGSGIPFSVPIAMAGSHNISRSAAPALGAAFYSGMRPQIRAALVGRRLLATEQRLLGVLRRDRRPQRVGPTVFFQFRFAPATGDDAHVPEEPAAVVLDRFDLRGVVGGD